MGDRSVVVTQARAVEVQFGRRVDLDIVIGVSQQMQFARTANVKLSPIKAMELAASRVPGVISLAQGIPSIDTPGPIKSFVQQKIAEGACAKYSLTPGLPQLRESIADALLQEGMHYDPDQEIIISAGSVEAIASTLFAITQPGDEVILPSPSYASYQEIVRVAGCTPRFAPLEEESNFSFNEAAFEECITQRTRAILYCNPNNPTGTVFSEEESRAIVGLAERHGLFLIIDEAYKDFIYSAGAYFSPAQLPDVRDRVVRIFTFSKAFGMTGWRVGYLHSDRRVVQEILKVHDALVTCAPVISQYAALAALEIGEGHISSFLRSLKQRRDLTLNYLDQLSDIFDYQKPEGAYFVFPRMKDIIPYSRDSQALAHDLLTKAKVAVVPGSAFGPTGESHIRLNFGRESSDITAAFERLTSYFHPAPSLPGKIAPARKKPEDLEPLNNQSFSAPSLVVDLLSRGAARRLVLFFLKKLARIAIWRKSPRIIAIAGSHGKTVVKRTIVELLSNYHKVQSNPRSYNTNIGLPLAILNVELNSLHLQSIARSISKAAWNTLFERAPLDYLVLEFGVRNSGDMRQLLGTVSPDIVILTTLTPSYSDDVDVLRTLQDEMKILVGAAGETCQFIVDGDDPLLEEVTRSLPKQAVVIRSTSWTESNCNLKLAGRTGQYEVAREIIGKNERFSVQAALAVAEYEAHLSRGRIARFLGGT